MENRDLVEAESGNDKKRLRTTEDLIILVGLDQGSEILRSNALYQGFSNFFSHRTLSLIMSAHGILREKNL